MTPRVPEFLQITSPQELSSELRREMVECWVAVSNAGGAVGFPFPPVGFDQVAAVFDQISAGPYVTTVSREAS